MMAAAGVQKGYQASASPMVEAAVASFPRAAPRGPRGARPFVRPMVVGSGARTLAAARGLREAPRSARGTGEERDACLREEGSVLRVFMGERTSVSPMGAVRGVLCPSALEVRGEGQLSVSGMEEARGAPLLDAGRVLREAPTSARPTVAERGARGATVQARGQFALHLLGEGLASVLSTVAWHRTSRFTGLLAQGPSWRSPWSTSLRRPTSLI